MSRLELLSGKELVSRGTTKLNGSLPTRGYKDVIPNGSWIEKKQVQCAIEARKHLIEVERIEKWGILTHAEWDPMECLAKVKEMKGSHWSHMGHVKSKQMCLYPEETLYLMETNCLELKYGGVTVSIQQAYTLLLDTSISFDEYRVYSALSRVGYKLFRHKKPEVELEKDDDAANAAGSSQLQECDGESVIDLNTNETNETEWRSLPVVLVGDIICESPKATPTVQRAICNNNNRDAKEDQANGIVIENEFSSSISSDECEIVSEIPISDTTNGHHSLSDNEPEIIILDPATDYFDNISDISKDSIVEISVPESRYLPSNIKVKSRSYLLNIQNIVTKKMNTPNYSYSSSDEETFNQRRNQLKAITNGNRTPENRRRRTPDRRFTPSFAHHIGMRYGNIFSVFNYCQFNFSANLFQRPPLYFSYFGFQNSQRFFGCPNVNQFNRFSGPQFHGARQPYYRYNQVEAQSNVNRYAEVTETIDITNSADNCKKTMKNLDEKENKHLEAIKTLVSKYKQIFSELNNSEKAQLMNSIRNLIKSFNVRYNKSIVLNAYNEVEEVIISSSDSDCVEMDTEASTKKRKISEERRVFKRKCFNDRVSKDGEGCSTSGTTSFYRYRKCANTKGPVQPPNREEIKSLFQSWLPPKDHFGYPCYKTSNSNDFYNDRVFFKYLRDKHKEIKFKSWKSAKNSYERHIAENTIYISDEEQYINEGSGSKFRVSLVCDQVQPLIRPQDCKDVETVLNRLNILKRSERVEDASDAFKIRFDVYTPCKAKNFKKTNLPRPAYRLVCLKDSDKFPNMDSIHATQCQCKDGVPLLFAIIGRDSVSYYQLGLVDLPRYIKQPEDFVFIRSGLKGS